MTDNNAKELLSECFLKLLATNARIKVTNITLDDGGFDVTLTYSKRMEDETGIYYLESGDTIYVQLKSTTEKYITRTYGKLKYYFRCSNYNKLIRMREQNKKTPAFLVLFIMPDVSTETLSISKDYLKLKKHAYWFYPSDSDKVIIADKGSRIPINIPNKNKFTVNTLRELFTEYVPI